VDSWRQALSLDPTNSAARAYLFEVYRRLGDLEAQSGRKEEAEKYYQQARELSIAESAK
jgi:tetratricopeptide (TPR) repeat protein